MSADDVFARQGFGAELPLEGPCALLIVDFVNAFADPQQFGGGNIPQAIGNTAVLLAEARQREWPVAHSRIVFAEGGSQDNIFSMKIPGTRRLTENCRDSQIVDSLAPQAGELVVNKSVPSAFFGTMLGPWLAQRGVKTVLVTGATTSGCVRASVVDAMSWGFRPVVVTDCVGDRHEPAQQSSLFDMAQKYATLLTHDKLLTLLQRRIEWRCTTTLTQSVIAR